MDSASTPLSLWLYSNFEGFQRWERDWIIWLLSDFRIHEISDLSEIDAPRKPVVFALSGDLSRSSARVDAEIAEYRRSFRPPLVFHLSDEWFSHPRTFYANAACVYRNYFRKDIVDGVACRYLPLGCSSGLPRRHPKVPPSQRRYLWSFVGERKRSRSRMLQAASNIPLGIAFESQGWEDTKGLGRADYAEILAESVFVLCPMGNSSVDTFRLYEALEFGAIPIVEDLGGPQAWRELLSPNQALSIQPWLRARATVRKLFTVSYWARAYPESFAPPVICFWETLDRRMAAADVDGLAAATSLWWTETAERLRRDVSKTVRQIYFNGAGDSFPSCGRDRMPSGL